jgi:hypothetical protein
LATLSTLIATPVEYHMYGTTWRLPGSATSIAFRMIGSMCLRFGSRDLSSGWKMPAWICLPAYSTLG